MNTEVGAGVGFPYPSFSYSSGESIPDNQHRQKSDTAIESIFRKQEDQISPTEKRWVAQVEKAIKAAIGPEKRWEFSVHKETNQVMVKVIDQETQEVIREVPPEKLLDMVAGMLKTAGLLIDKKW